MQISDNLRGTLYMCLSMMAFTVNDTFMKSVTQTLPLYQTIFLRGLIAVIGLTLIGFYSGAFRHPLPRRDALSVGLRALADVLATILFLTALVHMPLANLSAILQALPLAVTLGAAMVFGDKIGWHRMAAIVIGFVGVMIIIRPGADSFDRFALLGVASMICVAARDLLVRRIQGQFPSAVIALVGAVGVMVMGLIGTLAEGWAPVSQTEAATVICAGVFVIAGYLSAVTAMRWGEISLVAPFRYTSLLWAILLGWLIFADLPDFWTVVGASIVVAAGLFTFLRERQMSRNSAK